MYTDIWRTKILSFVTFDLKDRFEIGRWFFISLGSKLGFYNDSCLERAQTTFLARGVTQPCEVWKDFQNFFDERSSVHSCSMPLLQSPFAPIPVSTMRMGLICRWLRRREVEQNQPCQNERSGLFCSMKSTKSDAMSVVRLADCFADS